MTEVQEANCSIVVYDAVWISVIVRLCVCRMVQSHVVFEFSSCTVFEWLILEFLSSFPLSSFGVQVVFDGHYKYVVES